MTFKIVFRKYGNMCFILAVDDEEVSVLIINMCFILAMDDGEVSVLIINKLSDSVLNQTLLALV